MVDQILNYNASNISFEKNIDLAMNTLKELGILKEEPELLDPKIQQLNS